MCRTERSELTNSCPMDKFNQVGQYADVGCSFSELKQYLESNTAT